MIDTLSISLRTLSFIAIFQAAGMALFLSLFRRVLASEFENGIRRLAIGTTCAALLLVMAHFSLEPARMGGEFASIRDSTMRDLALHSPLATAFAWRMAGLGLLLVGLAIASAPGRATALLGAAITLFAFTQVGHAATAAQRPLLTILLLIHLAVVAFWFGALLPLRRLALRDSARAVVVTAAFSGLAMWLVPALFLAGLGMAALLLGDWEALRSPYGQLVILKAALFAVLMLLAALNKWRYGPSLSLDVGRARSFGRCVLAEYFLIMVVLGATATLTTLYSPEA